MRECQSHIDHKVEYFGYEKTWPWIPPLNPLIEWRTGSGSEFFVIHIPLAPIQSFSEVALHAVHKTPWTNCNSDSLTTGHRPLDRRTRHVPSIRFHEWRNTDKGRVTCVARNSNGQLVRNTVNQTGAQRGA